MPFRTVVHVFEQPSQIDPHPARHGRDGVLPEQVVPALVHPRSL